MKKIVLFSGIVLIALAIVLSGCDITGQAYVQRDANCQAWKTSCDKDCSKDRNQKTCLTQKAAACSNLKKCLDVPTTEEVQKLVSQGKSASCDADGVCEMKSAYIDGFLLSKGSVSELFLEGNLYAYGLGAKKTTTEELIVEGLIGKDISNVCTNSYGSLIRCVASGSSSGNATSCNADDTCEIPQGSYKIPALIFGNNKAGIFAGEDNRLEFLLNGFTAFQAYENQFRIPRGSTSMPGLVWSDETNTGISGPESGAISFSIRGYEAIRIKSDKNIQITSLKGIGNAYACINADGDLFRSDSPCNTKSSIDAVLQVLNNAAVGTAPKGNSCRDNCNSIGRICVGAFELVWKDGTRDDFYGQPVGCGFTERQGVPPEYSAINYCICALNK
jgi:hypothetical protein